MKPLVFLINFVRRYHSVESIRLSKSNNLLGAISVGSKEISCKSQKLLLKYGFIQGASTGIYHMLPPATKVLDKLINLVNKEMKNIGGEKIIMPCLTSSNLWKTTNRWESIGKELYTLKDRSNKEFCLSPTHEEAITELLSRHQAALSQKFFPLKLYQITTKFRDEMRSRFGLLRSKEFIMKDMYTFDVSEDKAKETYEQVCAAYENIFKSLGIVALKVKGSTGHMGGNISHEFHFPSDSGEDELMFCKECNVGVNAELADGKTTCENCGGETDKIKGIEIGHAFYLGETYTKPFKTAYRSGKGKPELLQMGCFGFGISRCLAASLEVLSLEESLRWPLAIAPTIICVITPKAGSKEESARQFAHDVAISLNQITYLTDNVVIDNRTDLTIGHRIFNAKEVGIPYLVVIGKMATESIPKIELCDVYKNKVSILTHFEIMEFFRSFSNTVLCKYQ